MYDIIRITKNSNRIPTGERVLFFLFLLKIIRKNKRSYLINTIYKMDVERVYKLKKS